MFFVLWMVLNDMGCFLWIGLFVDYVNGMFLINGWVWSYRDWETGL